MAFIAVQYRNGKDTMKTLLQLDTSLYSSAGQSSRLTADFVEGWLAQHPRGRVIARDLARDPVPHLTEARFQAFFSKPGERTSEQQEIVDYSDALIAELAAADVIAIGLPLYNFAVPSSLKAYFDHIARAGVTFSYSANGPVGLLTGKKVYVFATRGGQYAGTALDTQTAYVKQFLGFLGMTDIEFVYAEGLALGEATKDAALAGARASIAEVTRAELPAAA
jgi:FMN-dependent NADH-azoreductase